MTKQEIISQFKINEKDTGSVFVQVALLTDKIAHLTKHLQANPKDNHSREGLLRMVGQRKKLLTYLKEKNLDQYREIKAKLTIR